MLELDRALPGGLLRSRRHATAISSRRATRRCATTRPTRRRSPISCAARWSGCAAAPKARTTQGEGAHRRRPRRLIDELAEARERAGDRHRRASTSPPRGRQDQAAVGRRRDWRSASASAVFDGLDLAAHARHAARPPRAERLRQDHAAAHARRRARARRGRRSQRADGLRVVYFDQNRESLDPELTLARALAPRRRPRRSTRTARSTSPAWAKRVSSSAPSSSSTPVGAAVGRRAGPHRSSPG